MAADISACDTCFAAGKGCSKCKQSPNCAPWSKDTRCGSITPSPAPQPTPVNPWPNGCEDVCQMGLMNSTACKACQRAQPTNPTPGPQPGPAPEPGPGPPSPPTPPPIPPPSPPPEPGPSPEPEPVDPPVYPGGNDKNPFPGVYNDALPNFGLPLTCFSETRLGREIFGCFDERGVRYEYRGPPHPNSTTTVFGNWTGPAPYANDLPVKVKGRSNAETSALDSFSLLYTILCYDFGFHVTEIDVEYTSRIQAALARGVISPFKNANEFDASMKIVRSFQRTGHIFDAVNAFGETEYALRLGAIPRDSRWMDRNAEMTFPVFELTAEEKDRCRSVFALNPGMQIENVQSMLKFMESAGLQASYPYIWLAQRQFSTLQSQYAFNYIQEQMKELNVASGLFPTWDGGKKNDPFKQLQAVVSLQSLTTDLTASILETLL